MPATRRFAFPRPWRNAGKSYLRHQAFWMMWLALLTPMANAADLITERAVFEDASGALTFPEIQTQTFTPFTGILSRGYGSGALWVRLHLEADSADTHEPLILRIRPAYLDEVRLYDSQFQSLGTEITGDQYPSAGEEYRSLNLNLTLPGADRPRDIWLKIVTSSSRLLEVAALDQEEVLHQDRLQEIPYGFFLATLALLSVWGGFHWLMRHDRLMLLFTLKQTVGFLYMAGYLGYARLLWPATLTWGNAGQFTDGLYPLYTILGALFDYHLLRAFHAHRLGLRVLLGLIGCLLLAGVLLLLGWPQQAFMLNSLIVLIGTCLTPLLAVTTPNPADLPAEDRPPLSRRTLILYYLVIFLGFMPSVLPLLGLTQASFLVFDGFLIHSLVAGVAMLIVMMRRSRESERRLVAAEKQAVDERRQRQEQAQLLTMLAHELKTPLAVVRMVLGTRAPSEELRGDADRSVRDMSHIIQRCLQVEKLGHADHRLQRRPCHLGDEMRDLISNACRPSCIEWRGAELPAVDTDPMVLRMIVANLLDNACKYGDGDHPVTLHLSAHHKEGQNWQCLRVVNTPYQNHWPDRNKLFEKYYRAAHAHEHTGSGLGLYLSSRLAEQLGGFLRYQPTSVEIGFELWIPA